MERFLCVAASSRVIHSEGELTVPALSSTANRVITDLGRAWNPSARMQTLASSLDAEDVDTERAWPGTSKITQIGTPSACPIPLRYAPMVTARTNIPQQVTL